MAVDIPAVCADVTAALAAAGVERVTTDARDLNPPGVWVSPRVLAHDLLGGGGTVTLDLWLVAPDTGTPQALATLSDLLALVLAAVDPDADTDLAQSVTTPNGSGPLPAWRVTLDVESC